MHNSRQLRKVTNPENAGQGVLLPTGAEFSVCFHVQAGFEAHLASYPSDNGHYFVWIKAAEAPV